MQFGQPFFFLKKNISAQYRVAELLLTKNHIALVNYDTESSFHTLKILLKYLC